MDADRIKTLLQPFLSQPLSQSQLAHISTYIDLLLRWNARINLTAIRDPDSIVTRHFGESLFAAQTLFPPESPQLSSTGVASAALTLSAERGSANPKEPISHSERDALESVSAAPLVLDLVDVGSGPGFPGLPIKLWIPRLRATLIESQQKKVAFLREVIRFLTLMDVNVSSVRAEDFPAASALVTLRAVERFETILPAAARLVAPNGRLALLIGDSQLARAQSLVPSFDWSPPIPFPLSTSRVLLTGHRTR